MANESTRRTMNRDEIVAGLTALGITGALCRVLAQGDRGVVAVREILLVMLFLLGVGYFNAARRKRALTIALFAPFGVLAAGMGLNIVSSAVRVRLDSLLSNLDGGLSVTIYHWFLHHALFAYPLMVVYDVLFAFVVVSVLFGQWRPLLRTGILSSAGAFPIYSLVPAVGPAYVGQAVANPNCFPSMHVGLALLCSIYLPKNWRWIGFVFAGLTAVSAISTGEHYIVDVVAAVPYIAIIVALDNALFKRRVVVLQDRAQEA